MATVCRYATAKGPRYRVRYRAPGRGQTDKRGFRTKRAAEAWAAENEVRFDARRVRLALVGRTTVGELGPAWLDRQRGP